MKKEFLLILQFIWPERHTSSASCWLAGAQYQFLLEKKAKKKINFKNFPNIKSINQFFLKCVDILNLLQQSSINIFLNKVSLIKPSCNKKLLKQSFIPALNRLGSPVARKPRMVGSSTFWPFPFFFFELLLPLSAAVPLLPVPEELGWKLVAAAAGPDRS